MRIVFDGHIFRWQQWGGISRYFSEVISRLPAEFEPVVLGADLSGRSSPRHLRLKASPLSSIRPRRISQPLKKAWWQKRFLNSGGVCHPTYYNLTGGLEFQDVKVPIVITVHDFLKADFSHLEGDSDVEIQQQTAAILHATHLICVSKSTEQRLLELFPSVAGRTSVIYHGSSFPIRTQVISKDIFETPKFLYVGRRETYKNFLFLLGAFAKAQTCEGGIRLCIAGPPLTNEEKWQIHFLNLTGAVEVFPNPTEEHLRELYCKSVALLYPSRYEGFGIPPLEAMACGTLAVTSDVTSLPEVVGEAGIMLDPTSVDAWTDCILQIARQKIDRARHIAEGFRRAEQLSWDASARAHVELYRRIGLKSTAM